MSDESMWERYQEGTYFNPDRAILQDLIAELRDRHTPRDGLCNYCWSCDRCPVPWPCPDSLAADRAEARLREVTGDE